MPRLVLAVVKTLEQSRSGPDDTARVGALGRRPRRGDGDGGETTTTTGPQIAGLATMPTDDTTTTDVASAGPTIYVAGVSGATTRANPAGSPRALPATGPTETLMISLLGGALLGLGTLARRVARG